MPKQHNPSRSQFYRTTKAAQLVARRRCINAGDQPSRFARLVPQLSPRTRTAKQKSLF